MATLAASRAKDVVGARLTPLPLELLAIFERATITFSPTYRGVGIPAGNGMPVVLVPGFLGNDSYLGILLAFLNRIGYQAFLSEMGRNADCFQVLSDRLAATVHRVNQATGRQVCLAAHSFGDIPAEGVCQQFPDLVAGKISLASPKRIIRAHPLIIAVGRLVGAQVRRRNGQSDPNCYTESCGCQTVQSILKGPPSSVPKAAIYTEFDGVVDWRICTEPPGQGVNVPVVSTHIGIAYNQQAFKALAELLYKLRLNEGRSFA